MIGVGILIVTQSSAFAQSCTNSGAVSVAAGSSADSTLLCWIGYHSGLSGTPCSSPVTETIGGNYPSGLVATVVPVTIAPFTPWVVHVQTSSSTPAGTYRAAVTGTPSDTDNCAIYAAGVTITVTGKSDQIIRRKGSMVV
jgi:hypothetical protein